MFVYFSPYFCLFVIFLFARFIVCLLTDLFYACLFACVFVYSFPSLFVYFIVCLS